MGSRLVFLGPPGAGKGTQSLQLSDRLKIPVIATGNIFRDEIAKGTSVGKLADKYVHAGLLVPDSLVNDVVDKRLQQTDCAQGFILDGYPRNMAQAEALDVFLHANAWDLNKVLYFRVEPEVVFGRMETRRVCRACGRTYSLLIDPPKVEGVCDRCGSALEMRSDDRADVFRKRLEVYEQMTKPLLDYYGKKNLLGVVHASAKVEQVTREIDHYCAG